MKTLRVDIIVGGRFHADRMARALLDGGHEAMVHTSLPRSRFPGLPPERVRPLCLPEVVYRAARLAKIEPWGERVKMVTFGRAAARGVRRDLDVLAGWSSFVLEAFRVKGNARRVLLRDSTHIDHQSGVVAEEMARFGWSTSPSVATDRELLEYELADEILVPSEYARRTFLARGVSSRKLRILMSGVDTSLFHPAAEFSPGRPLKAVCFGYLSVRKGVPRLLEAIEKVPASALELHLVGPVESRVAPLIARSRAILHPAMSHPALAAFLRTMDFSVQPTLEDGFSATLVQAMASGLVPVTTDACGAGELIEPGVSGFVVPAGDTARLTEALFRIIDDPGCLEKMRGPTVAAVARVSWEAYGTRLRSLASQWTNLPPAGSV